MKPYPEYKDSGIEWIGKIPEHWETIRNKYLFNAKKGKKPDEKEMHKENNGNRMPYLSMEYLREMNVETYHIDKNEKYTEVESGDLLLLWDGSNSGEFIKGKRGYLSSTMAKIEINEKINKDFIFYLGKSIEILLKEKSIGMGIPHVNGDELKNIRSPLMNEKEQKLISNYLDKMSQQIENIILKKQQQIQLLDEYKTAMISHVVTKGLDPTVEMKDSGIEWIGEMPKHWHINKIKYNANIGSGKSPPKDKNKSNGKYAIYGANGIIGYTNEYNSNKKRILIGRVGAIGEIRTIDGYCWISDNALIVDIFQDKMDFAYSENLLKTIDYKKFSTLNAQPLITATNVKNENKAIPPINEQKKIGTYINNKNKKIEDIIKQKQQQIQLLDEYKKTLIHNAVTGKIDVRDYI